MIVFSFLLNPVGAQTFYVCSQNDVSTTKKVEFSNQGTTLNGQLSVSSVDSITLHVPDMRFVGGDMSLLTKYEEQKAQYIWWRKCFMSFCIGC